MSVELCEPLTCGLKEGALRLVITLQQRGLAVAVAIGELAARHTALHCPPDQSISLIIRLQPKRTTASQTIVWQLWFKVDAESRLPTQHLTCCWQSPFCM